MRAAAVEVEALFVNQMLEYMYKGIKTDGPFSGGHSEEVFRSFMLDEYAHKIAETGHLGIADDVMAEMIRMQEAANN